MNFREIVLDSGTKLLLGKNSKNNDELLEKFKGKSNKILHTVAPGSPFCVIENEKPTKEDIYLSASWCARYSQDWRDNKKDISVSVFTGKDVKKTKLMKEGTWSVRKSKTIRVKREDILKLIEEK